MAREDRSSPPRQRDGSADAGRGVTTLSAGVGPGGLVVPVVNRTPLFTAQQSERYGRQQLIKQYERLTNARLLVVIDTIFPGNVTYLEELLFGSEKNKPLHLLLASPGGDGETAVRMVRSIQARCSELTVIIPDMAKSAATLICLGADRIIMGPGGDLGPVDPQFPSKRGLVSAKEIVSAVAEAEQRISKSPETYPLFASLLSDVNMVMVQQARNSLARSEGLVKEALSCANRTEADVEALTAELKRPLIDEPSTHSAVISAQYAQKLGLPTVLADLDSQEWQVLWNLWARYYTLGCFPAGEVAAYEAHTASHVIPPVSRSNG